MNIEEIKKEFGDCDWMGAILNTYSVDAISWLINRVEELEKASLENACDAGGGSMITPETEPIVLIRRHFPVWRFGYDAEFQNCWICRQRKHVYRLVFNDPTKMGNCLSPFWIGRYTVNSAFAHITYWEDVTREINAKYIEFVGCFVSFR